MARDREQPRRGGATGPGRRGSGHARATPARKSRRSGRAPRRRRSVRSSSSEWRERRRTLRGARRPDGLERAAELRAAAGRLGSRPQAARQRARSSPGVRAPATRPATSCWRSRRGASSRARVLATIAGPGPISAETSKDGYLRRAGLDERSSTRIASDSGSAPRGTCSGSPCRSRSSARSTPTGSAPIPRVLARRDRIAIPVGWITGWFPPDRIVTFGFAVPIGAAIILVWILRRHHTRPWVTRVVVVVLAGWMIVGALLAWGRQAPFVSVREANVARAAMLRVSGSDIPIVVIVDDPDALPRLPGGARGERPPRCVGAGPR